MQEGTFGWQLHALGKTRKEFAASFIELQNLIRSDAGIQAVREVYYALENLKKHFDQELYEFRTRYRVAEHKHLPRYQRRYKWVNKVQGLIDRLMLQMQGDSLHPTDQDYRSYLFARQNEAFGATRQCVPSEYCLIQGAWERNIRKLGLDYRFEECIWLSWQIQSMLKEVAVNEECLIQIRGELHAKANILQKLICGQLASSELHPAVLKWLLETEQALQEFGMYSSAACS